MKHLSKSAQQKAEREARRMEKQRKRESDAAWLDHLRARARELTSRMPQEFAQWGVVKTRAYSRCLVILRNKAMLKTIKPERLGKFVSCLERHNEWSMEYCQELSTLSDTSKNLPEQL